MGFENAAIGWTRVLLEQCAPVAHRAIGLVLIIDAPKFRSVSIVVIAPEPIARCATKRIIVTGNGRKLQDTPTIALLLQNTAAEIILVPARHYQNYSATWLQAGAKIGRKPGPGSFAVALRI